MRTTAFVLLTVLLAVGCAGSAPAQGDGNVLPPPGGDADPCAKVELPKCPEACAAGAGELAGKDCSPEGARCGSSIGDGCTCTAGKWACAVHAPLGGPGVCNAVCR